MAEPKHVPAPRNPGSRQSSYYWDGTRMKKKKPGNQENAICTNSSCLHPQYVSLCVWNRKCRPRCERCGELLEPKGPMRPAGQGAWQHG